MATKTHERTLKMMECYMSLRKEGLTNHEIAERFNLSDWTVYDKLGQIAKKAGVQRDDLLSRNFIADHSGRNFTPVKPVDRTKFNDNFKSLMEKVEFFQLEIEESIKELEALNDIYEEEVK